ncbi:MAG: UvrD-helicase domain-containing protein [Anaerolineaceae bacterium]|nr:UvrD-helicase domain-containing protein [Anaerolineaceae bacterium]
MTPNLTADQGRAIETHDHNLVVLAAAGSGKTHVLVERMLALLEANPDRTLESLVAITFTRKAGREMRERLRDRLRERSKDAAPEDRDRWGGHLARVDGACIGTIHSLCTRILRVCATEAGLDPDFRVVQEDEFEIALDEALEETLGQLAEAGDPALALFAEYDRDQIMAALREQVPEPVPAPVPEDLLERWQREWERDAREPLQSFRDSLAFTEALTWEPPHGWPENDKLGEVWALCRPLCVEFEKAAIAQSPGLLRAIDDAIKLTGGTQKNWGDRQTVAKAKDLLRALREEVRPLLGEIGEGVTDLDRRAAELLPLWRRLIVKAKRVYEERRQAGNWLDFNGLEQRAYELLQQPEVRERLRREFRQVLVDEFHDTTPLQWKIIRALADPREPGRLFIVGDPRQSIYSFRGADVGNFQKALEEVRAADGLQVTLSQSFRSHQPLLDVLNTIHHVALPDKRHEPMVSERGRAPGDHPSLECFLMDHKVAGLRAEEGRDRLARELARRLQDLAAKQHPIVDSESGETRPLEYGDVALLFRTHNRMPEYEKAFAELGLPFVTLDGRGFYGRQEVLDLLNLLRALRSPADDLALASVLRSPLFALSDEELLTLRMSRDCNGGQAPLWDALTGSSDLTGPIVEQTHFARDCLQELATLAGRVRVDALLREALARTGYLATLSGLNDGERRRGNVEKLLVKAAERPMLFTEFESRCREFSQREVREGDAAPGDEGAITLMTVHGSKGLEFPLVVLADAGKWRAPSDTAVLAPDGVGGLACKVYDMGQGGHKPTVVWRRVAADRGRESLDERRRLLYVASTRARDYLIVCANHDGRPGDEGWLAWLHEALDLNGRPANLPWRIGGGKVVWRDLSGLATECDPQRDGPTGAHDELEVATSDDASVELPTLRPVPAKSPGLLHELAVTRLSDRFERRVMHSQGTVSPPGEADAQRQLGEALHAALRRWRPGPGLDAGLQQQLEGLLWEQGILNPQRRRALLQQATALLARFEASALAERMRMAPLLLQELPFMQRHGDCLIQGSIDLVMRDAAGNWTLVDFKSTFLGEEAERAQAEEHARRYWLQLGLYANALTQRSEVNSATLTVQVHYLRHDLDVIVPTAAWQGALANLEGIIAVEMAESAAAG